MTARTRLETGIARGWPLPPSDVAEVLAESDAHRTRADAAEADRDALRAECERLRAIYEAADEFLFCDYAAEVESYSETSSGSHAAAEVRASEAWNALVRLRDAERELRLATLPACASAPAGVVAAEAATRAALDGVPVAAAEWAPWPAHEGWWWMHRAGWSEPRLARADDDLDVRELSDGIWYFASDADLYRTECRYELRFLDAGITTPVTP